MQKTLYEILTAGTNTLAQPGDSIGVWTFDPALHAGQFKLQSWQPDHAGIITAAVIAFMDKQRYAKTTKFDALVPVLNQLVGGSSRLTVLIFCDGNGEIRGTPYDTGINKIFKERKWERQKARLPIVVGLRSQRGQYAGCIVSFPPQRVNLPDFPPLPEPIATPPMVTNAPAPPRTSVMPLIIVGTTITNRLPPPAPKPPPEPIPAPTNPPPTAITSTPPPNATNGVKPPDETLLVRTSTAPVQSNVIAAPTKATNSVAAPVSGNSKSGLKSVLAAGVAFLAGGLAAFLLLRLRKTGGDNTGGGPVKKD